MRKGKTCKKHYFEVAPGFLCPDCVDEADKKAEGGKQKKLCPWIWMQHPGHFILSHKCQFFLNTYVGKYIVSTVGELWQERSVREIHAEVYDPLWFQDNRHKMGDSFDAAYFNRFGFQDLGFEYTFETMVFRARKSKQKCCRYEIIVEKVMETDRYTNAESAYLGHMALCNKWANS